MPSTEQNDNKENAKTHITSRTTIIVGILTLIGTMVGSGFGYLSTIDRVAAERDTQLSLQRQRFEHEFNMNERELTSEAIFKVLEGDANEEEQRRILRSYAEIGIITGDIGEKLLALPDESFPTIARLDTDIPRFLLSSEPARENFEFSIQEDRLVDGSGSIQFLESPNRGEMIDPTLIIVHYTSSSTIESTRRALSDPSRKISAHLLIGRSGEIVQLVRFNHSAFHAGRSRWGDLEGLNRHSIGIELINAGTVEGTPGNWKTWFGAVVPDEFVVTLPDSNGEPRTWVRYTEVQLRTLEEVVKAIGDHYASITTLLGHSDVSPGRHIDPGPHAELDEMALRLGMRP